MKNKKQKQTNYLYFEDIEEKRIDAVYEFIERTNIFHEKISNVSNKNELIDLTACALIDPVIDASYLLENPGECLETLLGLSDEKLEEELVFRIGESDLSDSDKSEMLNDKHGCIQLLKQSVGDVLKERIEELSNTIVDRDTVVSNWLADVLETIKSEKHLDEKFNREFKDGFLSTIRATHYYYKKQTEFFFMIKERARTFNDICIWYSRYLLNPAVHNISKGYISTLKAISHMNNAEIVNDCCRLAEDVGIEPQTVDALLLRKHIQQLCKIQTGFFNPETLLHALN